MSIEDQKKKIDKECRKCTPFEISGSKCFSCLREKLAVEMEKKEQFKNELDKKE